MTSASRKQKRKQDRMSKKQNKHKSWIEHQKNRKLKKNTLRADHKDFGRSIAQPKETLEGNLKPQFLSKSLKKNPKELKDIEIMNSIETKEKKKMKMKKKKKKETLEQDIEISGDDKLREDRGIEVSEAGSIHLKTGIEKEIVKKKEKKVEEKRKKTNFEEYLAIENVGTSTAEEDLKLERRLAKKLKVKDGKLPGDDDGLSFLFDDSEQEYEPLNDDTGIVKSTETKKNKKMKKKRDTLEQDDDTSDKIMHENEDPSCSTEECVVNAGSENANVVNDKLREDRGIAVSEAGLTHLKSGNEKEVVKRKEKKVKEKKKKTNFEEYLAMENVGASTAEEDLKLERRLAKKLKVKDGKLRGDDDGLSFLFDDSEQEYDRHNDDIEIVKSTETKGKKKMKKKRDTFQQDGDTSDEIMHENDVPSCSTEECVVNAKSENANDEAPRSGNYVAPHLRARSSTDSNDNLLIRRRIRGLLNRLSESNMESITGEVSAVFQSIGRGVASQIVAEEVLASCAGGPRGNEQYAASFAAFISGLTCMVGIDFGAKILVLLAKSFEEEYLKEDNLSLRNLTLLLSYLYIFGVCSSDLIYDFLVMLTKQMTEIDVSTILTILQCCGMKLRSDDPAGMKEFIHGVQNRVTELKASSGDDKEKTSGRRMEFMLETICDIKNNKKKKEERPQHARVKKWLQKLRVDDITIHGITWSKLLDPEKKGQWWLTGDLALTDNVEEVASTIDKEVLEAQKMLELAASQRMNTDIRKAIFCVIMSGEDYLDAFEKLMRLDLQGKQDREIMRVLLDCCSQEKVFNKYYTALALKLCRHDKNHKFTLQYCLWDQFKELDSMPLARSMNLAKFLAEMLATFTLSLAVLKVVDLSDIVQLSPKKIMHFRMLFDTVFAHPDNVVWNIFTRIAVTPELEALRTSMEFFIMEHVLPSNVSAKQKFKLAKKALNNAEGILM